MLNWGLNRSNGTVATLDPAAPTPPVEAKPPVAPVKPRARIALALGGGAARGWAHIGVLRALAWPAARGASVDFAFPFQFDPPRDDAGT